MSDEVLITREGAVLTLTLNRPDVLNALDEAMHRGLADGLLQAADRNVRAVVLTGSGRGFCVGQDVSQFPRDAEAVGDLLRRWFNPAVEAIRSLEKPVLAAINGPAAGAGLALAMACDLRIAARSARLVPAFLGIGLVPDSGLSQTLPRLIGSSAAFEWLVSGRAMAADEAHQAGLLNRVVDDEQLAHEAAAHAASLAQGPTAAIAMTKALIDGASTRSFADQLEQEAALQVKAAAGSDFAEGVAAFLEKRPARFTGS
ncbi:MAG TPA: enoyl-CoA hydratase-related protein [Gaiellales bacterium]|nr:enoyl-CoA hydratase-related protein [Gaiellales bacterium]